MIHISEYLNESLVNESEKTVKSEKDFREYVGKGVNNPFSIRNRRTVLGFRRFFLP